ncbi:hypothetical protein TWF481_007989 [Arthrobotrys musiformis]|uniref:Uncharacterized protein n=1 Tax=Arthrobotrys musiformis TaxID=47236 RepID=A0AAV9W6S0_9PEZI
MDTPTASTYGPSVPDLDLDQEDLSYLEKRLLSEKLGLHMPLLQPLTLNEAPWPGYVYIISYGDTSQVITYQDQKVILAEYEAKESQRWVCRSIDGWLGFTNDPGESTYYMGYHRHDDQKLICRATHYQKNEMFCVRKRPQDGFQVLMVGDDRPYCLWPLSKKEDGQLAVVRGSKDWWGFTRTI